MYEDDPQDTVFDVLGDVRVRRPPARAADHRPRAGDPRHAGRRDRRLPRAALRAELRRRRGRRLGRPRRRSWSSPSARSAGCAPARRAPVPEAAPPLPQARVRFQAKDTEQVHVCLGGPGLPRGDERRYAVRVLDAIFGGLSSSRLFQSVREERGLAYAVYSFAGQFTDTGQIGLYVGTRPGQPRRGDGRRRRRARAAARAARDRGGAGAGEGERQGARRARHGVLRPRA